MGILAAWLTIAVGLWLAAAILPGFEVKGFRGALVVGAIFGVLHWAIGWVIFVIIGIGTLGLGLLLGFVTWWVVSAILLKVTDALSDALTIRDFKAALLGAVVLSAMSALRSFVIG